ncbi:MAG: protein-L-isoaspartate(D-aspartate) O-methyltransferase [Variibacter sp.]|nr:protein-L-isoaspartate(D-aspartate) O-methyltransferase [Variibacter sp.]
MRRDFSIKFLKDALAGAVRDVVAVAQGARRGERTDGEGAVPEASPADANVERMEFLLTLRRRGIGDAGVLRAMDEVPREHFVTTDFAHAAYADQALPIACGQTISQPYVVAYMTEKLEVRPEHRILEIGTGSGYQAAVLSRLAREVFTIERFRTLADAARQRLNTLGLQNVQIVVADGFDGIPEQAPFDRIIVTAAAETIPEKLSAQLAEGGIMLLPLGPHDGVQHIVKVRRTPDGFDREDLIAVRFVPLLPGKAREL